MRGGRSAPDQEGLRRVLLAAGAVLVVAAAGFVGYGGWRLVADDEGVRPGFFDIVVGGVLIAMAVACVRVARDDGAGVWCSECLARNPQAPLPARTAERHLTEPHPSADLAGVMEIVRVGYGHPDALLLIAEVQAEYVARYGGPDATPLDPLMFEPPDGSFFVGYLPTEAGSQVAGQQDPTGGRRPVATGAWRSHDDVEVFGTRRTAEVKRMYVVPAARARGLARRMLARLEASAAAAGAEAIILETGTAQPEAIALYESSGYTVIASFGHYRDEPLNRCFGRALPVH